MTTPPRPKASRRLRRALATAALSLTVVASVSACRVEQGAAFFVGDTRVAEAEVTELTDALPDDRMGGYGDARAVIVDAMVTVEVGKLIAEDQGITPDRGREADGQTLYAAQLGVEADNPVVKLLAERDTYRPLLTEGAEPVEPTDEDIDDVLAMLSKASGQKLPPETREQVSSVFKGQEGQTYFGVRDQVLDYFDEYHVAVNPRFGAFFVVYAAQGQPLIVAHLPE